MRWGPPLEEEEECRAGSEERMKEEDALNKTSKKESRCCNASSLVLDVPERISHALEQVVGLGLHLLLVLLLGVHELHGGDLVDELAHLLLDHAERDLVEALRCRLDSAASHVIEANHVAEHQHRLVERAEAIVVGIAVLLQEVVLDDLGHLKCDLVRLGQRALADELHDLSQILLILENLTGLGAQGSEVGEVLLVEVIQSTHVLGVGDEPVDGGEVLALGQLLVKAPEHLYDTQGGGCDGVGEITAGRGHGTDDCDGALAGRAAHALDAAGALVERGEAGAQVGGVARVGRHLSETTGDLTQSLGPTRGGVGHHGHVVAHVAEVLGEGDAGVDRGLTGSDRHVGCVGDEGRALHDRLLAAVHLHLQTREVLEHLGHLVAALAAADVDDNVRVGVLGERLRNDSLAAAKGAGNGRGAALHAREEGVEDALAGQQRVVGGELLRGGAHLAHGPDLAHGVADLGLAGKLGLQHDLVDCVLAGRGHEGDGALGVGVEHDEVALDEGVLLDDTKDVAAGDGLADRQLGHRLVGPLLRAAEGVDVDAARDVDALVGDGNLLQRALDAVEDRLHDAGAQLDREGLACAVDRVADGDAGRLLVHLDGGGVGLETDDLADELAVAHAHELVHGRAAHALGSDDRAGHAQDHAILKLASHSSVWMSTELLLFCLLLRRMGSLSRLPPSVRL
eukprot:m.9950 g.9950  ORF g.9950 m.9950 type:complete len:683 (-) comp5100_c0_seq1:47-2095(-)